VLHSEKFSAAESMKRTKLRDFARIFIKKSIKQARHETRPVNPNDIK